MINWWKGQSWPRLVFTKGGTTATFCSSSRCQLTIHLSCEAMGAGSGYIYFLNLDGSSLSTTGLIPCQRAWRWRTTGCSASRNLFTPSKMARPTAWRSCNQNECIWYHRCNEWIHTIMHIYAQPNCKKSVSELHSTWTSKGLWPLLTHRLHEMPPAPCQATTNFDWASQGWKVEMGK